MLFKYHFLRGFEDVADLVAGNQKFHGSVLPEGVKIPVIGNEGDGGACARGAVEQVFDV